MTGELVNLSGLQPGGEAYMEAVLLNAMHRRAHGPKMMIPGLHGMVMQPTTPSVVPVSGPLPDETPLRAEELQDTQEVVHTALTPTIPLPQVPVPSTKVLLTHAAESGQMSGFDLELEVTDICVDDESISMVLLSSARFKPKAGMRFDLKVNGRSYPVCFMGAAFRFPRLDLNGLSFIRIST